MGKEKGNSICAQSVLLWREKLETLDSGRAGTALSTVNIWDPVDPGRMDSGIRRLPGLDQRAGDRGQGGCGTSGDRVNSVIRRQTAQNVAPFGGQDERLV